MAVPKRKKSKSRTGMRRSHHALEVQNNLGYDEKSGEIHRSHFMAKDGFYNGKKVLLPKRVGNADDSEQNSAQEIGQSA